MLKGNILRGGFALPTVLIASVVMLTVLAISVSSVTAVRTSLKAQYYEQLAKVAGEAGVAYAKACLAKSGNIPEWTTARPLTPATDCAGNTAISCPGDARCSVMVNNNIRSSFTVTAATVDSNGRAISIPNNGYVELIRTSTGEVWRTYQQPAAQVAVVPDLCSGAASSPLGWSNAVVSSNQNTLPDASAAQSITLANGNLSGGQMYFRKDFSVSEAGTYRVAVNTRTVSDVAEVYVDGALRVTAQNQTATASIALTTGCHTVTVRLTNKTLLPSPSQFTAAIQKANSAPIVATDTSWRVSAGNSVHFSDPDYYTDSAVWKKAVRGGDPATVDSIWPSASGGPVAMYIGADCLLTCPASSSTYFRDSKSIVLNEETEVLVSSMCDDDCNIYINGNLVISSSTWPLIKQQTITLPAGVHHVAARLYNSGTAVGASKFAVALFDRGERVLLTRTDTSWLTSSNLWISGTGAGNDPIAFESSFVPSPSEIPVPVTYDALVVAGGGGGGGNCASCGGAGGGGGGGVILQEGVVATTGARTITIGGSGGGGAGGDGRTNGSNGANTVFGGLTAIGGGGGAAQIGSNGNSGGSGGGGSGGGSPPPGIGGVGIIGQGFRGGNGGDFNLNYNGAGGGGATGEGMNPIQPSGGGGGLGLISYISGARKIYGAGGGGGVYSTYINGKSDDSAGDGASQTVNNGNGYPATVNTGSGGGGANGLNRGGAGGTGGSGVVVIRYKKNSLTATVSGSGARTQSDVTIDGVVYTVHVFTSGTSTFNITAINS